MPVSVINIFLILWKNIDLLQSFNLYLILTILIAIGFSYFTVGFLSIFLTKVNKSYTKYPLPRIEVTLRMTKNPSPKKMCFLMLSYAVRALPEIATEK